MPRLSVLQKYLKHYAEPEIECMEALIEALKDRKVKTRFNHVLVIPCFDETSAFAHRLLASELWQQNILVIVVINQGQNSPFNVNNQELWHFFERLANCTNVKNILLCSDGKNSSQFLIVDRFRHHKIPPKEGVGLARKIGCDIACALIENAIIDTDWIHNSDADAVLPANYFDSTTQAEVGTSALVYNFEHVQGGQCGSRVYEATQLYESSLHYYYRGLRWAGSPFAFYTIGSTLAVYAEAYAQCRGFPKRAGAEDFYLLNKLAKLGSIQFIEHTYIKIHARISQRAPFGTGQAVQTIMAQLNNGEEFNYYAPQCFDLLNQWLNSKDALWQTYGRDPENKSSSECAPKWANESIKTIMEELNFSEFENHVQRQINSFEQFERAFHGWFDAFKTLKFIRLCQQHFYPAKPLTACLAEAPF